MGEENTTRVLGAVLYTDFELLDQTEKIVRFHADRGSAKAAVVFFRSAVW